MRKMKLLICIALGALGSIATRRYLGKGYANVITDLLFLFYLIYSCLLISRLNRENARLKAENETLRHKQ